MRGWRRGIRPKMPNSVACDCGRRFPNKERLQHHRLDVMAAQRALDAAAQEMGLLVA